MEQEFELPEFEDYSDIEINNDDFDFSIVESKIKYQNVFSDDEYECVFKDESKSSDQPVILPQNCKLIDMIMHKSYDKLQILSIYFRTCQNISEEINRQDESGRMILIHIAKWNHVHRDNAICLLLKHKADPNVRDSCDLTAADYLVRNIKTIHAVSSLQKLLMAGARVKIPISKVMEISDAMNRDNLLDMALMTDADVNEIVNDEHILIVLAKSRFPEKQSIILKLLQAGSNPDVLSNKGEPLWLQQILERRRESLEIAKQLFDFGADPLKCEHKSNIIGCLLNLISNSSESVSIAFEILAQLIDVYAGIEELQESLLIALINIYLQDQPRISPLMTRVIERGIKSKDATNALLALFNILINIPVSRRYIDRYSSHGKWNWMACFAICHSLLKCITDFNVMDTNNITILGYLSMLYNEKPQIIHDMMHHVLLQNANPNQGDVLPLIEIARIHDDIGRADPYFKTITMLLNYGADPYLSNNQKQLFWNYVSSKLLSSCTIIRQYDLQRALYKTVLRELSKSYHPIMYHPDRLRIRMHNAQQFLDEKSYQKWLENDSGWLSYLGIYDHASFESKMREYVRFMD